VACIHDFECGSCMRIERDLMEKPTTCECGNPNWSWTMKLWDKNRNPLIRRDFKSESDLVDDQGYRRRFTALEDPTLNIELGMVEGNGIQTYDQEQRAHYAGKILRDGDSPALRKEMLRVRKSNLDRDGFTSPETN